MNLNIKKSILFILIIIMIISCVGIVSAQSDNDTQRINTVNIMTNGDATWIIETRQPLSNNESRQDFQAYIEQIESNDTTQTDNFQNQFDNVVSSANGEFSRSMSVESLTLNAEIKETTSGSVGITTIEFTWNNFATVTEDRIIVGDILSEGYSISETERFRITPPENYNLDRETVSGGAEIQENNDIVEWFGPHSFSELELEYYEYTDNLESDNDSDSGNQMMLIIGVVVTISLVGLLYMLYNRKKDSSNSWSVTELKTDEEKIVALLEENNGRIKQKILVNEFDWSKTKVSRLTSNLENEGVIEKLTIGRENVLNLKSDTKKE